MLGTDSLTSALLSKVTQTPEIEAHWLNHLSQLEYVGARKILKAVPFEKVDVSVLRHFHEESGHAYLLKQVALEMNPELETWAGSKFSEIGWAYFKELDLRVSALLPDPNLAYPTVSFVVEERVMKVYPMYRQVTSQPKVRATLNRILVEEGRHETVFSKYVEGQLPISLLNDLRGIEASLWKRFCESF